MIYDNLRHNITSYTA